MLELVYRVNEGQTVKGRDLADIKVKGSVKQKKTRRTKGSFVMKKEVCIREKLPMYLRMEFSSFSEMIWTSSVSSLIMVRFR